MTHGRKTCNILKEIRKQIAEKNEIEYSASECHFEGECKGTCPKCESEVKYIENELHKRTQLGKAVAVAGISLGMGGSFSACNAPKQTDTLISAEQEVTIEKVEIADTLPELYITTMGYTPPDIIDEMVEVMVGGLFINTKDIIEDFFPPLAGVAPMVDPFGEDLLDYQKKVEAEAIKIYELAEVDVPPSFPGGDEELMKFLVNNIRYPRQLRDIDVEGTAIIRFVVEKDGSLSNTEVIRSPHKLLSNEAIQVIKLMPKWNPAQKDGKNVRVYFTQPILFQLN
jgi:TonB family protein